MLDRKFSCCFTGHRQLPPEQIKKISKNLKKAIISLIKQGVYCFMAGGALGFDTLAAQAVLALKGKYPHIKLMLVLPSKDQTKGWSVQNIKIYEDIKKQCDHYIYTSKDYNPGCMHKRNRSLVDHTSHCVCYLTRETGGTAYTVKYARSQGIEVVNLAEQ